MFGRPESGAMEMRARHQRAGFLWKLPMSNPNSDKWQKRLFVAKDGFLLYYSPGGSADAPHFDTKCKGAIPLGGCKVDLVERGPKATRYGLRITHPDFYAGRMLILAAESSFEQKAWQETLQDCSRVTMENAKLGEAMVEKLRAQGTAAEKEKADAMERMQVQALALKAEQEEKLKLHMDTETLKAVAAAAEERAKEKEAEATALREEAERRRAEMDAQTSELRSAIDERAAALAGANAEYSRVKALLDAGGGAAGADQAVADRARQLEEEKLHLEREKMALERSVRDLADSASVMRSKLASAEEQHKHLEGQLSKLSSEEGDLAKERQLRRRLERKLQIAEDSLKRLDSALKRSGVKLDVDVFADVKTLLSFFEERVDEVRRDAQRIEIMKKALKAKRRYLVASARADTDMSTIAGLEEAVEDGWDDEDDYAGGSPASAGAGARAAAGGAAAGGAGRATLGAGAAKAVASAGATAAAARPAARMSVGKPSAPRVSLPAAAAAAAAAPVPAAAAGGAGGRGAEDDWGDDSGGGTPSSDEEAAPAAGPAKGLGPVVSGAHHDEKGALPAGWTIQMDDADRWYYNESTGVTSWYRPNPDGSVPAA